MAIFDASVISSGRELQICIDSLPQRCSLYLSIEGNNISRQGSISLITILVHELQTIYIVDVDALGYTAFTTLSDTGMSLKDFLEDETVTKCFWDVRNAADALWAHYEVSLAGVIDVQLLENASRRVGYDKQLLCGFDSAIRNDLAQVKDLRMSDDPETPSATDNISLWLPLTQGPSTTAATTPAPQDYDEGPPTRRPPLLRSGTSHHNLHHHRRRPTLDTDTIMACCRTVLRLRGLRDVYIRRLSIAWLSRVRDESRRRVAAAHAPDYEPTSPVHAKGPWRVTSGTATTSSSMSFPLEPTTPSTTSPGFDVGDVGGGGGGEEPTVAFLQAPPLGPGRVQVVEDKKSRWFTGTATKPTTPPAESPPAGARSRKSHWFKGFGRREQSFDDGASSQASGYTRNDSADGWW